jgi:protein-S-isoprenylcysteine O-methyltransferase Ste14
MVMGIETELDAIDALDKPLPLWFIIILPFYACGILAVILFPIAKDWRWLEAWAFIITFAINIMISYAIINQKNPRVLRNRMKIKKKGLTAATQKSAGSDWFLIPLLTVGFFGALIVPGVTHRLGLSLLPAVLEIAGLVLTNIGLIIMNIALLQNSFASKLLDINREQYLIDTGLYAHVRHPLYAGAILMILSIPIALGSWLGLIPATVAVLSLVVRIKYEEEMLVKGMVGYRDYQTRVKYKLIPKIY